MIPDSLPSLDAQMQKLIAKWRARAVDYVKRASQQAPRDPLKRAYEARAIEAHLCADELAAALSVGAERGPQLPPEAK